MVAGSWHGLKALHKMGIPWCPSGEESSLAGTSRHLEPKDTHTCRRWWGSAV